MHHSMADLGVDDNEVARRRFERAFRVSADDAAEAILRGVQKNARRVLIGNDARVLDLVQRILPGSYHGLVSFLGRRTLSRRGANEVQKKSETPPRRPVASSQSN